MKKHAKSISLVITILVVALGVLIDKKEITKTYTTTYIAYEQDDYKKVSIEDTIDTHVSNNEYIYKFYSDMFGIEEEVLINNIKESNKDNTTYNELDVGNIGIEYNTFEESLLRYIENLESNNKDLFNRKYTYKKVSKSYIYGLIDYFSSMYTNVDVATLKAIAHLESGNLNSITMLKKNNIFGSMYNGKLTKYSSIEYGVYKYVKLLSESYYGKGLTTIEQIGYKYNPTIIKGKTVASPSWVSQVKSIREKYISDETINSLEIIQTLL